ncbi:VOC family protein [Parvibaculum lavamentivorans]|nr:VOC family protein [Parvibaculum lavamentivorans]
MPRFHLAFAVDDLSAAREFYGSLLGCPEGRSAASWIDFDLYGHQIVAHLGPARERGDAAGDEIRNAVDGDDVPVPHFGLILAWEDWHALAARLKAAGTSFVIEPHIRFAGEPGEQATMFFRDPSGNALEFKAFQDESRIFAREF